MRIVGIEEDTTSKNETIKVPSKLLEELKLTPGNQYIIAEEGDILTLTPLILVNPKG